MTEWEGWSTDRQQVERTRVLKALLSDVDKYTRTAQSVAQAVESLGLTDVDADDFAESLFRAGIVDEPEVSVAMDYGSDTLQLTAAGNRVRSEFAREGNPLRRRQAARRAILHWLADRVADYVDPSGMLVEPLSWFYGVQFTTDELSTAALNLRDRQYVIAIVSHGGAVPAVKLTTLGLSCVELYRGDPDEMDRGATASGITNNFHAPINQHGNNSVGSTAVTQTWTSSVTPTQTAADLAGLLTAVRMMGIIPQELQTEANEVSAELQKATHADTDPTPALSRVRALFGQLNDFASTNPAAVAILTADGNYAALRMGISTS